MPQYVDVNGETVEFPDNMSDDQIADAIKRSQQPAQPKSDPNKLPYLGPNWGSLPGRAASATWGVVEPVLNFPGRVAQAGAEATGAPQALDSMLSRAKGVPAQPDPMVAVSDVGVPESEPWTAGGTIREGTNFAANPLTVLKLPGMVKKGYQAAQAARTAAPAADMGKLAMQPRPNIVTGSHLPQPGELAPPTTALSPRPTPQAPPPLPTASEIATQRTNPLLRTAAEAGVRRREGDVAPRFGHDPLPQPKPGTDVTQLVEEPSGSLLKQLGVPLMGVAASVLPFLEGLLRPKPPRQ